MALGSIASIVGIAGGLNSLLGAGGGGSGPSIYRVPGGHSQVADIDWLNALRTMMPSAQGVPGQVQPLLQQGLAAQSNLPTAQYQQAGQAAAGMYPQIAGQDINVANILNALAGNAIGRQGQMTQAGTDIWNTANDPQGLLKARTQAELTNAIRSGESARGIATSPYGAGIENKGISDFLLDWNNQQLGRQATGVQGLYTAGLGANQANQLGGQDLSSMLATLGQAPQNILQGGYTPLGVGQNIGNVLSGAANQYAQGVGNSLAPLSAIQSQIIPYLYSGMAGSTNAFNMFNQNRQFDANQQAMGAQGLTQGLNQFSNSPWGTSTNNWLGSLFGQNQAGGM